MSAFDKIAGTKKIADKRFFCRHIYKLQAGPAHTLKIGNASSEFNIAFL
jgi:hypothetical protein